MRGLIFRKARLYKLCTIRCRKKFCTFCTIGLGICMELRDFVEERKITTPHPPGLAPTRLFFHHATDKVKDEWPWVAVCRSIDVVIVFLQPRLNCQKIIGCYKQHQRKKNLRNDSVTSSPLLHTTIKKNLTIHLTYINKTNWKFYKKS